MFAAATLLPSAILAACSRLATITGPVTHGPERAEPLLAAGLPGDQPGFVAVPKVPSGPSCPAPLSSSPQKPPAQNFWQRIAKNPVVRFVQKRPFFLNTLSLQASLLVGGALSAASASSVLALDALASTVLGHEAGIAEFLLRTQDISFLKSMFFYGTSALTGGVLVEFVDSVFTYGRRAIHPKSVDQTLKTWRKRLDLWSVGGMRLHTDVLQATYEKPLTEFPQTSLKYFLGAAERWLATRPLLALSALSHVFPKSEGQYRSWKYYVYGGLQFFFLWGTFLGFDTQNPYFWYVFAVNEMITGPMLFALVMEKFRNKGDVQLNIALQSMIFVLNALTMILAGPYLKDGVKFSLDVLLRLSFVLGLALWIARPTALSPRQ